jgi:hypothetical protein
MPKIEIDLADLGLPTGRDHEGEPYGSTSLSDLIIEAASAQLLRGTRDLQREVREKVDRAIQDEIEANVKSLVAEAFTAPIQRTTAWGEKQGDPTTVREIIRESIEKYLNGPAAKNRSYNYKSHNLQELINDSTKDLLEKDFMAYLKQVKEGVKVTVHQKALQAAVDFLQK